MLQSGGAAPCFGLSSAFYIVRQEAGQRMEQTVFIDLLQRVVIDSAATDTIANLAAPPGRQIPADRKRRAAWFNSLSAEDRANVEHVAQEAARIVAFGFLCVLDGCRVIEDYDQRGHLELHHIYNGTKTLLSSSADDSQVGHLHELL